MLYTNKFIVILKWRKCNNFFKQLMKGNVKYTKKNYTSFHYFILFWGTIFWHSIDEKYFMIWYSLEYSIMQMFDYSTKILIITLREFTVESKNHLGWELDISTRPQGFFKYCLKVSMNTSQSERLTWKTVYSIILANNNTKWVSSQLFGCGRAKFGPLGRGHLHHLMLITELLLLWPAGHMDSLLTLYSLLCVTRWQRNGVKFLKKLRKRDGHFERM